MRHPCVVYAPILTTMTTMHHELSEIQAAHRAELGALREMLAAHGPTGHDKLDNAVAERMRDTVSEILRLQKLIGRLDD
jgi:hypothetical protein